MFEVQKRMCSTCIYKPDSPLDLKKLEDDVREVRADGKKVDFFKGHRICHHSDTACCAGFWAKNKNKFQLGQIAQRFNMVEYVEHDTLKSYMEKK